MRTNYLVKSFLLAGLILPAVLRADAIVNGGFETTSVLPTTPGGILYNASPWVTVDPNTPPFAEAATGVCLITTCASPFGPHSGSAYFYGGAWRGSTGNGAEGTVSQEMPTTFLTDYVISFWLAQPAAGTQNSWTVKWDGILLDGGDNLGVFPYTHFLVPTLSSLAGMDTVKFSFFDDRASGELSGYELDDVSIIPVGVGTTGVSALPEPGSGVLVAMVFVVAGLVGVVKKRFSMLASPRGREDS